MAIPTFPDQDSTGTTVLLTERDIEQKGVADSILLTERDIEQKGVADSILLTEHYFSTFFSILKDSSAMGSKKTRLR